MEPTSIPDPFTAWREFYNQAEQSWTDIVQKMISTPASADAMGKTAQLVLNNFEAWRSFSERYLTEVWNIPTRNDLGRLGEVVVGIDAKADDLDDRAEEQAAALAKIEERLAGLGSQLSALNRIEDRQSAQTGQLGAIGAITERLAALENQVAVVSQLSEPVRSAEARLAGLDRLERTVAGLADPSAALARIEQRLTALEERLAASDRERSVREQADVDQIGQRVAGLEPRLTELLTQTAAILNRLEAGTDNGTRAKPNRPTRSTTAE